MRWTARALGGSLALCTALSGPVAGQQNDAGRALFLGRAAQTDDPALAPRLVRLPCMSCHGRDGQGATEGRAPPIEGPSLARATPDRPAYDAAAFQRAVTQGRSSGGRELSQLMPRYPMSAEESAALFAYLAALPAEQRRGVTTTHVTIGVPDLPPGSDRYRQTLQAALDARLGGGLVHGRHIVLMPLAPDTPPDALFAAIGIPLAQMQRLIEHGVPVLFPLGQLTGAENPGEIRDFLPTAAGERRSLARHLATQARGRIAIWPAGPEAEALDKALDLAGRAAGTAAATPPREIVVLDGTDLDAALETAPGARLWIGWRAIRQAQHLPSDRAVIAIDDMPGLVGPRAGDTLSAHARRAGMVLAEVLKQSGRDLTRARLMQSFGTAWLGDLGLDYAAEPLSGTDRLEFVPLP